MATFRINYSRVISQANSMNDLASDLNREIRVLEDLLTSIKNEWKGPGSEAYQAQLVRLINDMKSTKSQMANVTSTIKSVARRIQAEDERLARLAAQAAAAAAAKENGGGGSFGGGGGGR